MKTVKLLCAIALILATALACELVFPVSGSVTQANPVIPIIMGVLSLLQMASQVATQKKAQKETKRYQTELEGRRSDYEAWFKGEYNTPFMDTEMGQSARNQLGATLKSTLDRNRSGAIRTGATTESQVAAQGQGLDVFAQALNQLTSQGTQYKQNLRSSYDYNINNYLRPLDQMAMGSISNWNQLGGQIGDSSSGLISALGQYDWNQGGTGGTGGIS